MKYNDRNQLSSDKSKGIACIVLLNTSVVAENFQVKICRGVIKNT